VVDEIEVVLQREEFRCASTLDRVRRARAGTSDLVEYFCES